MNKLGLGDLSAARSSSAGLFGSTARKSAGPTTDLFPSEAPTKPKPLPAVPVAARDPLSLMSEPAVPVPPVVTTSWQQSTHISGMPPHDCFATPSLLCQGPVSNSSYVPTATAKIGTEASRCY